MTTYGEKAKACFLEGYNCTQAVVLAFTDELGIDRSFALKVASSFGGGMGRLREVCGAVSGMFMIAGLLRGYDDPKDVNAKKEHYALIQELARQYTEVNGSIVCRDLLRLQKNEKASPVPDARTAEYYKKRPCPDLVALAADIVAKTLNLPPPSRKENA